MRTCTHQAFEYSKGDNKHYYNADNPPLMLAELDGTEAGEDVAMIPMQDKQDASGYVSNGKYMGSGQGSSSEAPSHLHNYSF